MDRGTPRVESEQMVQSVPSDESADSILRRSENIKRQSPSLLASYYPTGSFHRSPRQFPTLGELSMDVVYEQGEWPWKMPTDIIAILKENMHTAPGPWDTR